MNGTHLSVSKPNSHFQENKKLKNEFILRFGRDHNLFNKEDTDIIFHKGDRTVSRHQFDILYDELSGHFFLVCHSLDNPTAIKVLHDKPIHLKSDQLLQLNESQFFKIEEAKNVDSNFQHHTRSDIMYFHQLKANQYCNVIIFI